MDTYLTLASPAEGRYTEKRSNFLAFVVPCADEEEARTILAGYRKKYYDARHVCWAYRLGTLDVRERANDDGEPSGSAGRPILGQLVSHGLTGVLAVVVRYFGGVKLGTGGLCSAYKAAVADALAAAAVEERVVSREAKIYVPYADADTAMRFVREGGGEITARDYDAGGTRLTVSVRADAFEALCARLSGILSLRFLNNETPATS